MKSNLFKLAQAAILATAMALTLSCSTDNDGGGKGTNFSCQLSTGSCIETGSASDCSTVGGYVVDLCSEQPPLSSDIYSSNSSGGLSSPSSSGGGYNSISSSSEPSIVGSSSSQNVQSSPSSSSSGGYNSISSSSEPSIVSSSSSQNAQSSPSDGGSGDNIANYKTKQIGTQVWMAENLNYDVPGSKCYNDDPANCAKYGRLYDWATAMALPDCGYGISCASQIGAKHRGICPSGWHIPTDEEWTILIDFVGRASTAGTKLKSKIGWESHSGVPLGTDEYGFSALPGGFCSSSGIFSNVGYLGDWWSATEWLYNGYEAYGRRMYFYGELVGTTWPEKDELLSVRCLQD